MHLHDHVLIAIWPEAIGLISLLVFRHGPTLEIGSTFFERYGDISHHALLL